MKDAVKSDHVDNVPQASRQHAPERPRMGRLVALRLARLGFLALAAALAIGLYFTWKSQSDKPESHGIAMQSVEVTSVQIVGNDVRITGHFDAPSPDGTTHSVKAVIPAESWKESQTVWACYKPDSPQGAKVRTPLDPLCPDLFSGN